MVVAFAYDHNVDTHARVEILQMGVSGMDYDIQTHLSVLDNQLVRQSNLPSLYEQDVSRQRF